MKLKFLNEPKLNLNMLRIFAVSIFTMIFMVSFGQARLSPDGLYYNNQGKLYTGTNFEFYSDSVIHVSMELKDGKPDGLTKIYFENGNLEEIRSLKMGHMDGKWEKWNIQNVKTAEANYSDNKKDGKWYIWDENGTLRYDMTYKDGVKAGTWLMFDEKGILKSKKVY